jgi:hypothetical protein
MKLGLIFDTFSRRQKPSAPPQQNLTKTFRNRVVAYCIDVFAGNRPEFGDHESLVAFWQDSQRAAIYRTGSLQWLMPQLHPDIIMQDGANFVVNCTDEEFLDFVESIFKGDSFWPRHIWANQIVSYINHLFDLDDIGYQLTPWVEEEFVGPGSGYPFHGKMVTQIRVLEYPRVIRRDDQVTYATIIGPALLLLTDPAFKTANAEYLEALEDYRKVDYGDCLTKCGSAFESTMKIICSKKNLSYKQTDTAAALLDIIKDNTNIEPYMFETFKLVATLRNRQSKAHGAGTQPKTVSPNTARYALGATATAVLFLVEETK